MNWNKIFGALLIVLFCVIIVGMTILACGLKMALFIWGAAIVLAAMFIGGIVLLVD